MSPFSAGRATRRAAPCTSRTPPPARSRASTTWASASPPTARSSWRWTTTTSTSGCTGRRRGGGGAPPEGGLYIIQPDARWTDRVQSQVPVYPRIEEYGHHQTSPAGGGEGWEKSPSSVDEVDEGVGGTPDYPCDTGDEASVLSVDVHTSSTSLSSAATPDEPPPARTPPAPPGEGGGEAWRGEEEEGEDGEEVQSVTDSMVAEALAALEAATAGEDCE
ncbi:uncharacterized protein ACNS7B_021159 [Menidia menidia]